MKIKKRQKPKTPQEIVKEYNFIGTGRGLGDLSIYYKEIILEELEKKWLSKKV